MKMLKYIEYLVLMEGLRKKMIIRGVFIKSMV